MAVIDIITEGDPRLRQKAIKIRRVDAAVRRLAEDMYETMLDAPGVGLAAPQVGVSVQLCVIDVGVQDNKPGSDVLVLFNPKILAAEGKVVWNEGCLSLPEFEEDIERAAKITVEALDREGKPIRFDATDLKAVCIQHEMDHLKGITLAEKVSFLKRNIYLKKVKKGKIERPRPGSKHVVI